MQKSKTHWNAGEAGNHEMQHSSQEPLVELWKKSLLTAADSRQQNYKSR